MNDDMSADCLAVFELFLAQNALKQVYFGMNMALVFGQRVHPVESLGTNVAHKCLLACMFMHVNIQPVFAEKPLITFGTFVLKLSPMERAVMTSQRCIMHRFETTQIAKQN